MKRLLSFVIDQQEEEGRARAPMVNRAPSPPCVVFVEQESLGARTLRATSKAIYSVLAKRLRPVPLSLTPV